MENSVTSEELARQGWKRRDLPGFMGMAGPLWTRRDNDAWAYAVLADETHLNPAGVVHGGALLTLLDHAISSVAWEACGRQPCLTLQLDTQFVGSVYTGQLAQAHARVIRCTGSLVFMQGEVSVDGCIALAGQALVKIMASPRPVETL